MIAILLERLRERIELLHSQGLDAAYAARREHGTVGLDVFAATRPERSAEELELRKKSRVEIQAQLAAIPRAERIAKYAAELRTYEAYAKFDAELGELVMPLLVVYGTGDSVFPDVDWPSVLANCPNATYLGIDGAGHGMIDADPEVVDRIFDFFIEHIPPTN